MHTCSNPDKTRFHCPEQNKIENFTMYNRLALKHGLFTPVIIFRN